MRNQFLLAYKFRPLKNKNCILDQIFKNNKRKKIVKTLSFLIYEIHFGSTTTLTCEKPIGMQNMNLNRVQDNLVENELFVFLLSGIIKSLFNINLEIVFSKSYMVLFYES